MTGQETLRTVGRDRAPALEIQVIAPDEPGVGDFLRRATLEGVIRTIPAGRGRIFVLPAGPWARAMSRPDA